MNIKTEIFKKGLLFLLGLISISLINSSCSPAGKDSAEKRELERSTIEEEIKTNHELIRLLRNQAEFRQGIPIQHLNKLNELVLRQADTSMLFRDMHKYDNSPFDIIRGNYVLLSDSVITGSGSLGQINYQTILDKQLKLLDKVNGVDDDFLKGLYIIKFHNVFLKDLLGAFAYMREGPDRIPILKVVVRENGTDFQSTVLEFQIQNKDERWLPMRLIRLSSYIDSSREIRILSQHIKNDKLILKTERLKPDEYMAEIELKVIKWGGYSKESPFKLSFYIADVSL
jgi:hypothetical protein